MKNTCDYLDLLSPKLDDEQNKVCKTFSNAVVGAGAGSGKTEVLARRFAYLVMEYDDIGANNILTLTFTKKAAGEMYNRIYKTLKTFANNENVPERQRNNAKNALEDFSNVHIQTLDSYCSYIVRQAANRYGIKPNFSQGDESNTSVIQKKIFSYIVKNRARKSIKHFSDDGKLKEFSDNVLSKIILEHTSLATDEMFFRKTLAIQKEMQEDALKKAIFETLPKKLQELSQKCDTIKNEEILKTKNGNGKNEERFYVFLENITELEQYAKSFNLENEINLEKTQEHFRSFIELFSKLEKHGVSASTKNEYKNSIIKNFQDFIKNEILSIRDKVLTPILTYIKDFDCIEDIHFILEDLLKICNTVKRTSGILTFKDISDMALKILIEQKDIRTQEKLAYSKIMIDEFQDNNSKNRDFLFLLAEKESVFTEFTLENANEIRNIMIKNKSLCKDKLFFVGDEKQSIYKFRKADVSVFNELKDDLEKVSEEKCFLHMVYNYRSTPALIKSFNKLFGAFNLNEKGEWEHSKELPSLFPEVAEKSFHATYSKDAVAKIGLPSSSGEKESNQKNALNMSLFLNCSSNKSIPDILEKEEQVAYYVAEKIKTMKENGIPLNSIAILERSRRAYRNHIIKYLRSFSIPYILDNYEGLFSDGPANDIYNFLKLIVYPSDTISFASHLASPFVNLSESAIEFILAETIDITKKDFVFTPFSLDEKLLQKLNPVEKERYTEAKKFYEKNKESFLACKITDIIETLWYECGYRYETLLDLNTNIFSEHFDVIFELARKTDRIGESLAWFVDELSNEKNKEQSSRNENDSDINVKDLSLPNEKENAVQIMTIHKSKGLQFDYVFALGCIKGGENQNNFQKFYFDEETGVSFSANKENYFYLLQKDKDDEKENAEFKRLIYVALTRAKKECFIVNTYSVNKEKKDGTPTHNIHEFSPLDEIIEYYYPDFINNEETFLNNENAPFSLEKIQTKTIFDIQSSFKKNRISQKEKKQKEIKALYSKIEKITSTNVKTVKRFSPSSLEKLYDEKEQLEKDDFLETTISKEIDNLVPKIISSDNFGTIVHYFLEMAVNDVSFEKICNSAKSMKEVKDISAKKMLEIFLICQKNCTLFLDTEYGKIIKSIKRQSKNSNEMQTNENYVKTEHAFKLFEKDKSGEPAIITGVIDLVVCQNGSYIIIDYKTDKYIVSDIYKEQQLYYRKALSKLKNIPESEITCMLYYVRYDKFIKLDF